MCHHAKAPDLGPPVKREDDDSKLDYIKARMAYIKTLGCSAVSLPLETMSAYVKKTLEDSGVRITYGPSESRYAKYQYWLEWDKEPQPQQPQLLGQATVTSIRVLPARTESELV